MSDLTNITNLSGLTITSDQTTGTNNPNATFAIANLTQTQINALENVTPYTVNGNTVKVKPGTMVFNITTGQYQIFTALAQWENISTNITTATGIGLTSSPFSVPAGTSTAVEVAANQVNGFVYYATDLQEVRAYIAGAWMTLYSEVTGTSGAGLTNNVPPLLCPAGTKTAVEVAANQVNGFVYYNTEVGQFRGYVKNTWSILFSMPDASSDSHPVGNYLDGGIPLLLPTSLNTSSHLEIESANHVVGFAYYNSTNHNIRVYTGEGGSGWGTITITND